MKFYNPFKPHVIELACGVYYVRKYTVFGCLYLDSSKTDTYWWTTTNHWNTFKTLESALDLLNYNPDKITKVYQ